MIPAADSEHCTRLCDQVHKDQCCSSLFKNVLVFLKYSLMFILERFSATSTIGMTIPTVLCIGFITKQEVHKGTLPLRVKITV